MTGSGIKGERRERRGRVEGMEREKRETEREGKGKVWKGGKENKFHAF